MAIEYRDHASRSVAMTAIYEPEWDVSDADNNTSIPCIYMYP